MMFPFPNGKSTTWGICKKYISRMRSDPLVQAGLIEGLCNLMKILVTCSKIKRPLVKILKMPCVTGACLKVLLGCS